MNDQEKLQQVKDLVEIRNHLDQATKMIDAMLNEVSRPATTFVSQVGLLVKALAEADPSGMLIGDLAQDTKIKPSSIRAVLSVNKDIFFKLTEGRKSRWKLKDHPKDPRP